MYKIRPIDLDLKTTWSISRNSSHKKRNFILSYENFHSEIAPNIRYGENSHKIIEDFQYLVDYGVARDQSCSSFLNAFNNIELKRKNTNLINEQHILLDSKETSFSIPIMDVSQVSKYLEEHNQYNIYKLKISNEESLPLFYEVIKNTNKVIRLDANEGFDSLYDFLKFHEKIEQYNIQFIEQPFKASMKEEYRELKGKDSFEIMGDESITNSFNAQELVEQFDSINIKLMKCEGIANATHFIEEAQKYKLKTMLGCMIETSLGISEALMISEQCDYIDLDGALLIKDDPYRDLIQYNGPRLSLKKEAFKKASI